MPVAVPVLEEDAIKLVVHATIRGTKVDSHVAGRIRVNIEAVHFTSLDGNLAVFRVDSAVLAVDFDSHDARLDAEVFCLELVKMQERAFGPQRRLDQPLQVLRDVIIAQVVLIGLAEKKATARWWLKELGSQEATEPVTVSELLFQSEQAAHVLDDCGLPSRAVIRHKGAKQRHFSDKHFEMLTTK